MRLHVALALGLAVSWGCGGTPKPGSLHDDVETDDPPPDEYELDDPPTDQDALDRTIHGSSDDDPCAIPPAGHQLSFSAPEPGSIRPPGVGLLRGRIVDLATRDRLTGVTVTIPFPDGSGAGTMSGSDGEFTLDLAPGVYTVVFYYADLEVAASPVIVKAGMVTAGSILLDTESDGGQAVHIHLDAAAP